MYSDINTWIKLLTFTLYYGVFCLAVSFALLSLEENKEHEN